MGSYVIVQEGASPQFVRATLREACALAQDLVRGDFTRKVGVFTNPPAQTTLYWHFGKDHDPVWHEDPLRDLFAAEP